MIEEKREPECQTKAGRGKKINVQLCLAASTLATLVITSSVGLVWAETGATNGTSVKISASDQIKNNPVAMKILENIALYKQGLITLQKEQQLQDEQNKLIEEQRALAKQYLQNDLERMANENTQNTPRNAFASFVANVNTPAQGVFWDEFSFMEEKVRQATEAMNKVRQNGGTIDEALQAFYDEASTHKSQLVNINNGLNVKYHLATEETQNLFDKFGKIPGHQ